MRLIIIHQHDPGINCVGGIGTFINTFIKYAPADFEISLVGVSSEPQQRQIGRWQRLNIQGRDYAFLPIVAAHPNRRRTVPLSLRFTWALARYRPSINFHEATLMFHRIEPSLALRHLGNPKVLILHAHMHDLYNPKTEVLWGKFPQLYFWLERRLIQDMASISIVREDAVSFYRARYPNLATRFAFLPTWVDESIFVPLSEDERFQQKQQLGKVKGFDPSNQILLFVGRFEGQKDPLLLLEAFRHLNGLMAQARLVMIGEGSLEPEIRAFLASHRLDHAVHLIGPKPQSEIARWMNVADCLALSSAYEGMPLVVLEALHCGLPVVSTNTGEVKRLIEQSVGRLVDERTPQALAAAIAGLLRHPPTRQACQQQAASYTASKALEPVYQYYRQLSGRPQ